MRRALWLLATSSMLVLLALPAWPGRVEALSPTCLPGPLPMTPLPPVFTINRSGVEIDIWRQACTDGSGQTAALARITPSQNSPSFVCSSQFVLIQNAAVVPGRITLNLSGQAFCSNLAVPATFYLLENFLEVPLNVAQPFTVLYTPPGSATLSQLEIPAPGPLPAGPPSIAIIPTGCTTCHSNGIMGFNVQITNPGSAMIAQIKFGGRLADGTIVAVLGADHQEVLGAGQTIVVNAMPAFTLPNNLPTADVQMEAAVVEPQLGVTLSRTTLTVHMLP